MRRQVVRLVTSLVSAAAVVVSLGGCGEGPSQVGAAAIVGSEAVPLEQVQGRIEAALSRTEAVELLAAQGVGPPDIGRDVVTQSVLHELTELAAADAGIVVNEAEIDASFAADGGLDTVLARSIYDAPVLRERRYDELVAEQLGRRAVDGLAVAIDVIGTTSREDAEQAARVLAAGGPAAEELFARNSQTSQRNLELRPSTAPDIATDPLFSVVFGTPQGRTGYFQLGPDQSGWLVFRVVQRRTDAPPEALEAGLVSREELVAIGRRLLQPVAEEVGVRVNPRYGVWDPVTMRVIAEGEASGAVLPLAAG